MLVQIRSDVMHEHSLLPEPTGVCGDVKSIISCAGPAGHFLCESLIFCFTM